MITGFIITAVGCFAGGLLLGIAYHIYKIENTKPMNKPLRNAGVELGDKVYHKDVYWGREQFTVVGIRANPDQVELYGDWSGGTHDVRQRGWIKSEGILKRKTLNQ